MEEKRTEEKVRDEIMAAVDDCLQRDHAELNITKHQNQVYINDTNKTKLTVDN